MSRVGRTLAVCATGLMTLACSPEGSKQQYFESGQQFLQSNRPREAIVDLRNAVRLDARWGEARLALADAYAAAGQPELAYREYLRAADLMPDNDRAQIEAARYLVLARQFEDALARITPLVEGRRSEFEARIVLAEALAGLGDSDAAFDQLHEAVALAPSSPEAHLALARLHFAQDRLEEARAAYEKARTVAPTSAAVCLALADFHRSTGDAEAAERVLRDALTLDAENLAIHRALADVYVDLGRPDEAERELTLVADRSASPEDRFALADFYLSRHRLDEALRVVEPLADRAATRVQAATRLARIEHLRGDAAAASNRLRRVLANQPNQGPTLLARAERALARERWDEALWEAEAAIAADPRLAGAHRVRAQAQLKTGRYADALISYAELARLQPDDVDAKVALSRLHLARGSIDTAVLYGEEALHLAPDRLDVQLALARAWIARGDDARAAAALDAVIAGEAPAEAHVLRAALRLRHGETALARTALTRALEIDPESREALAMLTSIEVLRGDVAGARRRVDEALGRSPNDAGLLVLAAKVRLAAGETAEAEQRLRRAIARDHRQIEAFGLLARVFGDENRLEEAVREFDARARADASDLAARLMAAVAVHASGDLAAAERRYRDILGVEPRQPLAANNLAAIYLARRERLDEATLLAEIAEQEAPHESEILDTLGAIYYERGLYGRAVRQFERAVAAAPRNPTFHYRLGLAYAKTSDVNRAREAFESALRLNPHLDAAREELETLDTRS